MIVKSPTARTRVVWSEDPALDRSSPSFTTAWGKYLETRDVDALKEHVRDGYRLTVFEVGPLSRPQYARVINAEGAEKFDEAVAYGLRGIGGDGVRTLDANGTSVPVALEWEDTPRGRRLKEHVRDALYFPTLWAELFTAIVEAARPHP